MKKECKRGWKFLLSHQADDFEAVNRMGELRIILEALGEEARIEDDYHTKQKILSINVCICNVRAE